jgi:hypothetical protein
MFSETRNQFEVFSIFYPKKKSLKFLNRQRKSNLLKKGTRASHLCSRCLESKLTQSHQAMMTMENILKIIITMRSSIS